PLLKAAFLKVGRQHVVQPTARGLDPVAEFATRTRIPKEGGQQSDDCGRQISTATAFPSTIESTDREPLQQSERLSMRKVREVLRLRHALGLSYREISEALRVGKTSVGEFVRRAEVIGITWPLPGELDDGELEPRLFTAPATRHAGAPQQREAWSLKAAKCPLSNSAP